MAKKQEEKIDIFGSAKVKIKGSKPKDDKEVVYVDGLEPKLLELEFLKAQIEDLKSQLNGVADEIKNISKEKFVELYKSKKSNPNTFLIKDGEGCVMVIPTDKYTSIKDEDRVNELIDEYGDDIITTDGQWVFNTEVLERNIDAIKQLLMDAKTISNEDKKNLLVNEKSYSISKGYIDKLAQYGSKIGTVVDDIQPIIALKNCGGKMEEGGMMGDDFIGNIYEDGDIIGQKNKYSVSGRIRIEKEDGGYDTERVNKIVMAYNESEAEDMVVAYYENMYGTSESEMEVDLTVSKADYEDGSIVDDNDTELYYSKDYFEYADWNGDGDNNGYIYGINLLDENGDVMDAEWFKSDSERRNYILENNLFEYKFEGGGFLGGIFGGGRTYKKGLAYKLDRAKHNKSEDWEVPMKNRKKRYEDGDMVDSKNQNIMKFLVNDRETQKELENYLNELSNKYFNEYGEYLEEEGYNLDNLFNISVFNDNGQFKTTFTVPFDDDINFEISDSIEEKFGDIFVPYYYEGGGFLGGIFGGGRTYKKGLAYKLDRAKHNKSENWEVPMKNRKKRYEDGGKYEIGGIVKTREFLNLADEKPIYVVSFIDNNRNIIREMRFGKSKERLKFIKENKLLVDNDRMFMYNIILHKPLYNRDNIIVFAKNKQEAIDIAKRENGITDDNIKSVYEIDNPRQKQIDTERREMEYYNGGGVEQVMTDEMCVIQSCVNGEIHCDMLEEIIGSKPNYPYQQVGSIRLEKCYLRPYYKIS